MMAAAVTTSNDFSWVGGGGEGGSSSEQRMDMAFSGWGPHTTNRHRCGVGNTSAGDQASSSSNMAPFRQRIADMLLSGDGNDEDDDGG